MADKPNFVLVPDDVPSTPQLPVPARGVLARLRTTAAAITAAAVTRLSAPGQVKTRPETTMPVRPRLVFSVDATASREPAWAAARQVTDALFKALPGELDVALAVHGGSRVHTFTAFTNNAATLRDRATGITCRAGMTRLLPILSTSLTQQVRVVVYIGDVFEESVFKGRQLADAMGQQSSRLIVLHDTTEAGSRRDAEVFWDLAKRTGGCVLPFDASASGRLRDLLSAVAVYTVGGEKLLQQRRHDLPGAVALLEHLGKPN